MRPDFTNNNKERIPYEHYLAQFKAADPAEMAKRTGLGYDEEKCTFTFKLMDSTYEVTWPEFDITCTEGSTDCLTDWAPAQILMLRYLTEGSFRHAVGTYYAYQEMPWGDVYYRQFYGRCILRLAYTFNNKADKLRLAMESVGGTEYKMGDMGWEFEFLDGLYVRIAIWNADDEFPPSAQILFSDNFREAFTAEDMAFVGDIFIKVLKNS